MITGRLSVFQAGGTDVMKKRAERFGAVASSGTAATAVTRPVGIVLYVDITLHYIVNF